MVRGDVSPIVTAAAVIAIVVVVVGNAMWSVRDIATCDSGAVATAAETWFVSSCAVEVCNAALRAKANNITEASSTTERGSVSHAVDVTVVAIARFSASAENEKQTHFR